MTEDPLLCFLLCAIFLCFHGVEPSFSSSCSDAVCNGIPIGYPFWRINSTITTARRSTSDIYCGYPGLGLSCRSSNDTGPILTLDGDNYYVRQINYTSQSITLVDVDVAGKSCPRVQHNLTIGSYLLDYNTKDVNITFYFNCSVGRDPPQVSPIPCFGDYDGMTSYVVLEGTAEGYDWSDRCEEVVVATVHNAEISNSNLIDQFARAMNMGFTLDWETPEECRGCEFKEGRCGSNNWTNEALCLCGDGSTLTKDTNTSCKGVETKECATCISSGGRCNYSSTAYKLNCHCPSGEYESTCPVEAPAYAPAYGQAPAPQIPYVPAAPPGGKSKISVKIAIDVAIAIGGMLLSVPIIIYLYKKLKQVLLKGQKSDRDIENFIKQHGSLAPKRFSYSQVKRMTSSFNRKLGQGGFGSVYKGELPDGTLVAVKLLNASEGNGEEFINEVASISKTSHINIVTLLGFCFDRHKRALIYEFMSNGSLDKFINDKNAQRNGMGLTWDKLYRIAMGTARGLEYLHRGCSMRILHFDIKPQNILLDDEFCPKISDFGLSKLCLKRESIVSMMVARGTVGYIAPEVFSRNFGDVSHKSDVYSYGMMLLEMVGGRNNNLNDEANQSSEMYFHDQVYQFIEDGYDQGLYSQLTEEDKSTVRKMALVGVWCIQTDPNQRPSIGRVVEMLEGNTEALPIPPKPFLFPPPRAPRDSLSVSTSM